METLEKTVALSECVKKTFPIYIINGGVDEK